MWEYFEFRGLFGAYREITAVWRVRTPCTYVRVERRGWWSTPNATRYQFGQLNDPHLQGAKRVICSVISAAAASSPYRALPLFPTLPHPLCYLPRVCYSTEILRERRIYRPRGTLLHGRAQLALHSHIGAPRAIAILGGVTVMLLLRALLRPNETSEHEFRLGMCISCGIIMVGKFYSRAHILHLIGLFCIKKQRTNKQTNKKRQTFSVDSIS